MNWVDKSTILGQRPIFLSHWIPIFSDWLNPHSGQLSPVVDQNCPGSNFPIDQELGVFPARKKPFYSTLSSISKVSPEFWESNSILDLYKVFGLMPSYPFISIFVLAQGNSMLSHYLPIFCRLTICIPISIP
jgi:hypothetical protein